MEGRMADSKMPTEETEILTEEFRRVKGNTGRFKVKKEKINFESFVADVKPQEQSRPQSSLLALPGTAEPDIEVGQDPATGGIQKFLGGISDRLAEIEKNLSDMLDMDAKELADEKKDADKERVVGEKQKKRDKESKLESGIKGIGKKVTDQVTKPMKGLFDTILNFFTQIFLGNLVKKLIEFIDDPMLIFNPLIGMVNGVIDVINNVLEFMFGGLVENINKMIGPLNGGLTNLENTVNSIFSFFGGQEEEDKIKLPRIPEAEVFQFQPIEKFKPKEEKKEEPIKGMTGGGLVTQEVGGYEEGGQVVNLNFGNIGGFKGGDMNISPKVDGFKGGGKIDPTYNFLSPITNFGYTGGGSVINTSPISVSNFGYTGGGSITGSSGQTITGMGPDTQLIAAQPGEIMMSKKAVQAYGANNLLAMNKDAGGTNVPTRGTIQGFSGGGMIEVQGTGNTVEGTLKMKDAAGKQVGKTYSAISGTYAGMNVAQKDRGYTTNAPMPDGEYKLTGFQKHGDYPGLPGIGHWSTYVNNGSGSIGSRSGLMLHNDIGSNGTLGCIGVELGGVAGTKAEQEFLQAYEKVNPQTMKVALGKGGGDASKISPVSSRPATSDNSVKASVSSPAPKSTPGPPPSKGTGGMSAIPIPGSNQQQPPTSSVSAGQKDVPSFSSRDMGNTEFIVIKSIYNIAG